MDLEYVLQLLLPIVTVVSVFVEFKLDKAVTQGSKTQEEFEKAVTERRNRRIARGFTFALLFITLLTLGYAHTKSKEKDRKSEDELKEQKAAVAALSVQIDATQKEVIAQQQEVISQAKKLEQSQAELIQSQQREVELSSRLLNTQTRGLHQLNRIGLDRMLSGLEISYKPTAQEWKGIVDLYKTLVPTNGEKSYYESPIIATRAGAYWRIDFAEISMTEGRKWFSPVFTDDVKNRGFEQILQRASLPLWITWGTGAQTFLEPMRGDYPSEIRLSPEIFIFTLRPPLLELNLDSLHENSIITLRSRRRWSELTFHSLDPAVKLDQTLHLKWDRANLPKDINAILIKERLHGLTSGPHRLQMSFKTLTR